MTHGAWPSIVRLVFGVLAAAFVVPALANGADTTRLMFVSDAKAGLRPRLATANGDACDGPAAVIDVVPTDGPGSTIDAAYTTVRPGPAPGTTHATVTVTTAGGSVLDVADDWSADSDGGQRLRRSVTVRTAGTGESGFGTGVEFAAPNGVTADAADIFIPGVWYAAGAHTPLSSPVHARAPDVLIREGRLPLPLVSVRDRASGLTLTLTHAHPDGTTVPADANPGRLIDERLAFASVCLHRPSDAPLRLSVRYPGTDTIANAPPMQRFHPLRPGLRQQYEVVLRLSHADTFARQIRDAWRAAFNEADPLTVPTDVRAVEASSINLLAHYAFDEGGASGVPFSVGLRDGKVRDPSLQMGFIGMQLPCASYLIAAGLRDHRPDLLSCGERMADFWAAQSLSSAGVPRTWFDLKPQPHWRDYPTYLRVATDGTSGLLRAWQAERAAGRDRPAWLAFCRAVGDWLVRVQHADGSFDRCFSFDGRVQSDSRTSTLHPVRLLVDLSCATGDSKYRAAAERAGRYALAANTDGASYVGGTPDNPDVIDREAGYIAMGSYLALYDATGQTSWLDAAVDAATFTETWAYAWDVPLPAGGRPGDLPPLKTTAGVSLIAAGHSGTDCFLSFASFDYARLALYTGDAHFARLAGLLQHNVAQLVDTDGHAGFGYRGLLPEAFSLAVGRGQGVGTWLPWCTAAILEPMERMQGAFGQMDAELLLKDHATERHRQNTNYGRDHGFTAAAR